MSDDKLEVLVSLIDQMSGPLKGIEQALDSFNGKLVDITASFVSLQKATEVFGATIAMADKIQDVNRSLVTFTGSVQQAQQAMATFEAAQDKTRSTALELAQLYTTVLPLGIRQGWSQGVLQQITVGLDQLAVKAGQAPEAMIHGFDQLLAGRVTNRNPLLQVLGLTADDIKTATDAGQTLFDAIMAKAGAVPDSFASMTAKIKEQLSGALGQGFIESFGQGTAAVENFRSAFTDPSFLDALKQIGAAIAQIVAGLTLLPKATAGIMTGGNAVLDLIGQAIGASGSTGALNRGDQAAMDMLIQQLRQRNLRAGPTPSAGTLFGQQMGYQPWYSTGLDTSPGHDTPPMDASGGGVGGLGLQGVTTDADNARAALQKLLDLYTQQKPYVSFDQFTATNAASIEKATADAKLYGIALTDLQKRMLDDAQYQTAYKLPTIPGATTTTGQGLIMAMSQKPVWSSVLGAYVTIDDSGNATVDASRTQALIDSLATFTSQQSDEEARYQFQQEEKYQKQLAQEWQTDFVEPLSAAFADLGSTGGKNIAQIFGQALAKEMQQAAQGFLGLLTQGLAGTGMFSGGNRVSTGDINPATNQFYTPQEANQANAQSGGGIASGYGQAAIGIAGFALNAPNMSSLQGAISGFTIGQSIGGAAAASGLIGGADLAAIGGAAGASLAGGLIGAFVGAVVIAIGQATPTIQTYAVPMIKNGLAQLTNVVGSTLLTDAEQNALLTKIQTSFDSFRNGYIQIFLGLPADLQAKVLPQVAQIVKNMMTGQLFGTGTTGGGTAFPGSQTGSGQTTGAQFGSLSFPGPYTDPSNPKTFITPAQVQQYWQEWISNQLPQAVMQGFMPAFQTTFTGMGVTLDKFHQIWTTAQQMDPQAALTYLGGYMQALGVLQGLIKQLSTPVNAPVSGLWATTQTAMGQSFVDSLASNGKDILNAAQGLTLLTGQSQVDQINKINTLLTNRYQLEQQFIQQIIGMIQSAKTQLSGDLLNISLQGKTPAQQRAILQGALTTSETGFGREANTTQLTSDYNTIHDRILQILGLNPNDPATQAWASSQLTTYEGIYERTLRKFGTDVDTANAAITAGLGPAVTLLTTDTTQFGLDLTNTSSSVTQLDTAAKSAASSVLDFSSALQAATAQMANMGYTASVRRSRAA